MKSLSYYPSVYVSCFSKYNGHTDTIVFEIVAAFEINAKQYPTQMT